LELYALLAVELYALLVEVFALLGEVFALLAFQLGSIFCPEKMEPALQYCT
jgi:hypothetical protein